MPHIRSNFPLQNSKPTTRFDAIKPYVFIDKVTVRLKVAQPVRIKGREYKANFVPNYRWTNVAGGKVAVWANGLGNEVFVTFNPSTMDTGYNIFPFKRDVTTSIRGVLSTLANTYQGFPLTRLEHTLIRGGYSKLSEIHITADFEFPSIQKVSSCMRDLKTRWKGKRTRKTNDNFLTGLYLNHTNWSLLAYVKDDEIDANHSDWPDAIKRRCRNRLRIEIKLKRQELHNLGRRLQRMFPDLPLLDLAQTGDWEPNIYPLVFDCYAKKLLPIGYKRIRGDEGLVLVYGLIDHHRGRPVSPSGNQTEATYYKGRGPGRLIADHNLIERADPHADAMV
jgi:hypothetical protein